MCIGQTKGQQMRPGRAESYADMTIFAIVLQASLTLFCSTNHFQYWHTEKGSDVYGPYSVTMQNAIISRVMQ